jgi:Spy/CpxP family protein refolding chaperone
MAVRREFFVRHRFPAPGASSIRRALTCFRSFLMSLLNSGPASVRARGGLRGRALLVTCLAVFVASAAAAPAVFAQSTPPASADSGRGGGGGRGGNGERMMEALFNGITLTDAQKKTADSIHAAYGWQIAKVTGTTPWITRRDLRQKEMADLRGLLTPAQQPAFDKNLDAIRARMMGRGRRGDSTAGN